MEPGLKEQPILGYKYDESGKKTLVIKGIKDRYKEAQDALPGVELKGLLERYANGDLTALERVKGMYGDFTETPTSYIEALNTVQDATEAFNRLPKEIKEAYNNNVTEFVADIGSEKFNKYMNNAVKGSDQEIEPINEEVKE